MFGTLYTTILLQPLYNGLVGLASILPGHDLGLAIIALTLIVRFILFPLSKKAAETQVKMRMIEPKMKEIRETIKDKQEQGAKMLALYRDEGVNPFSSVLLILIQLPIIFALYRVFLSGVESRPELLYSFMKLPETVNSMFLGSFDLTGKSIIVAILVGVSQYFVMHVSMGKQKVEEKKSENTTKDGEKKSDFQSDFARSMQFQMRYLLPPFIAVISYSIGGAISLYWITSNIFQLTQELLIKRRLERSGVKK